MKWENDLILIENSYILIILDCFVFCRYWIMDKCEYCLTELTNNKKIMCMSRYVFAYTKICVIIYSIYPVAERIA